MNDAEKWKALGWNGRERIWDSGGVHDILAPHIATMESVEKLVREVVGAPFRKVVAAGVLMETFLAACVFHAAERAGKRPSQAVRIRLRADGKVDIEFDTPWRN
jgi:hypothetical protein